MSLLSFSIFLFTLINPIRESFCDLVLNSEGLQVYLDHLIDLQRTRMQMVTIDHGLWGELTWKWKALGNRLAITALEGIVTDGEACDSWVKSVGRTIWCALSLVTLGSL